MGMSLFLAKTPSNVGFLALAEAPQLTLQAPLEGLFPVLSQSSLFTSLRPSATHNLPL